MMFLSAIYQRQQRSKKRKLDSLECNNSKGARVHTRRVKKYFLQVRTDDGSLRQITPKDTLWYLLYVKEPPRNNRIADLFRRRFRLPYGCFLTLLDHIKQHPSFCAYRRVDCVGYRSTELSLLLLGSLRYLGRAWTFDDVEEATAISRESIRKFFLKFIKYGSINLFKRYVTDAAKMLRMRDLTELFTQAGFNGCIGSTDATHVPMLSCWAWAQIVHKGGKSSVPCRTFNVTVTHSRQIIGSTSGHPATFNDKTLIMFDKLLSNIRRGEFNEDHVFSLLEKDKDGNIVEVEYVGAWFIVDNGYLNWSCTVPPMKNALSYKFIRMSEWLESMRKDVECTFGILKGRFTILKTGVKLHGFELTDQIWLTCCALHNMLLFADGLDDGWEDGKMSYWEKEGLQFAAPNAMSFAEQRLNRDLTEEPDMLDESEINNDDLNFIQLATVNGKRYVNKLPLRVFRKLLANNFHIRFDKNTVKWPKRMRNVPKL